MQDFPIFKTKMDGDTQKFDLANPDQVKEYFNHKAGLEIAKLRKYLETGTFVAYMLGKKNAGKGTYSKIFADQVGKDKVAHISVGDMVRGVDEEVQDSVKRKELISYLEKNYRGYHSIDAIIQSQLNRGTDKPLLPTEYILALLGRQIAQMPKKVLFIDGLPRSLDQISYSLFFRQLIGFRDDPDMFVLIQIPESVIDLRMKNRVVCPKCGAPRSPKLLMTKEAVFDEKEEKFYLLCDNEGCDRARMVPKEGDEKGIEPIRSRLNADGELIEKAFSLYGIPKVLLRNSIPVSSAKENIDDYETTPEYCLKHVGGGKVEVSQKPLIVLDDNGVESYTLLAYPVVVGMIKQICDVLGL